jgi:ERCC4-related helicase
MIHPQNEVQQTVASAVIAQNSLTFIPHENWKYHLVALTIQSRLNRIEYPKNSRFITLVTATSASASHWLRFILDNFSDVSASIFDAEAQQGLGDQSIVIGISSVIRDAIISGLLHSSRIDTIVIDECQLAIGNNPTASICEYIRDLPDTEHRPLVLGFTSSPVNCKKVSYCYLMYLSHGKPFLTSSSLYNLYFLF